MTDRVIAAAAELQQRGEAFVLATVVWRRGPSSGRTGAKALVLPDGSVRGWLGGACAEPTVVRESLLALADGQPRLLFLGRPDDGVSVALDGLLSVPMACASEGAMEVYLEPMLPEPLVVVIGRSPAADTLASLAIALGWRATVVDDGGRAADHESVAAVVTALDLGGLGIDSNTCVVVATQGHYDEAALEAAVRTDAGYIGLVASRKRSEAVFAMLRERGVPDDALARVHSPAGLDLGSVGNREIAVAVLAEMVAARAAGTLRARVPAARRAEAIDPVCGMTVDVASAHHVSEYAGRRYYFCAAGCRRAFDADPASFLTAEPAVATPSPRNE